MNNKKKIRVGLLFGGKSAEHEISLKSAQNVVEAIDQKKYQPLLIKIDKTGLWFFIGEAKSLLKAGRPKLNQKSKVIALVPESRGQISDFSNRKKNYSLDVVFPLLHGPLGEDGTVQGLLKLADLPFVGAGVLGSAIGMDKEITKRLLREAKIPIGQFITLKSTEKIPSFQEIIRKVGIPFFVKPANLGSSVGINKVKNESALKKALKEAFQYDTKILIEEFTCGREIECAILGNDHPLASRPGEIITRHEFYSYEAKYLDENGAILEIPAKLSPKKTQEIQNLAIKTFKTLSCAGLARVDFFLKKGGEIIVNEMNTMPGFTKISMYPKLWAASGISYSELINRLIQLAIERFNQEKKLKTDYLK